MILRSFGALFMWLNLFYYLQGLRGTGPYVRTIIEVSKDMLGFMVLYISILAGFSHAFFVVFSAGSGSATVAQAMSMTASHARGRLRRARTELHHLQPRRHHQRKPQVVSDDDFCPVIATEMLKLEVDYLTHISLGPMH